MKLRCGTTLHSKLEPSVWHWQTKLIKIFMNTPGLSMRWLERTNTSRSCFSSYKVRTKIDLDVWNNKEDNQLEEALSRVALHSWWIFMQSQRREPRMSGKSKTLPVRVCQIFVISGCAGGDFEEHSWWVTTAWGSRPQLHWVFKYAEDDC